MPGLLIEGAWKMHLEACSALWQQKGRYIASHPLNAAPGDGQPHPGAFRVTIMAIPIEGLAQRRPRPRAHANAVVAHPEDYGIVLGGGADPYPRPGLKTMKDDGVCDHGSNCFFKQGRITAHLVNANLDRNGRAMVNNRKRLLTAALSGPVISL